MIQNGNLEKKNNKYANLYWILTAIAISALTAMVFVFAAKEVDFWTKLSDMFADVYDKILGISTIVAVVVAAIALVIRMVSKNQRSVDEATQWLKRIVVTWVILNGLGFIVAYIAPLVEGGKYEAD
ncbi:MAG: hypothetical protein UGF89_10455 [Acutalibacteraceae bacterium]|nr:hypothetical protein [Acutalibacteraceae bacterium]